MEAVILTKVQFDHLSKKLDDLKQILFTNSVSRDTIIDNTEFIKRMSISKRTAQNWRDKGKIAFSQIGSKIYYKLSDIDNLLSEFHNPTFNK